MTSRIATTGKWSRRDLLLLALTCLVVTVPAIALGLPRPAADDLFYTGAAFSLSAGHGLNNPLLATQFGTSEFLVYPTFYFELLALWLRLTGISTFALLLFQHLAYIAAGVAMTLWLGSRNLLPRSRWPWPALFAFGLLTGFGRMGLRPESAAFAVLFWGLVLRDRSSALARFVGWLLIGSSILISPHMLFFGAGIVVALQLLSSSHKPASEWKLILAAASCLFGLFAWSVDGRVVEFVERLSHHAERISLPLAHAWGVTIERLDANVGLALAWVALGISAAPALLATARKQGRPFAIAFFLVLSVGLISALLDVTRPELRITLIILWTLACSGWLLTSGHALAWLPVALTVFAVAWELRSATAALTTRGTPSSASIERVRALVTADPHRRYLVDSFAARYVFDYQLPENSRDWVFGRPYPRLWPESVDELTADETWIISGYHARLIAPETAPPLQKILTIAGRSLNWRPGDYDLHVYDGRSDGPTGAALQP